MDIKVPAVGESITEGVLSRWLKKNGEAVAADEPVFELETEKATTEIPAPAAGRLAITVPEGQTVAIGAVVGRIAEGAAPAPKPKEPDAGKPAVPASPAARRLAEEENVDVRQLQGSGRGGRVTKEDVVTHVEQSKTPPPSPPPAVAFMPTDD